MYAKTNKDKCKHIFQKLFFSYTFVVLSLLKIKNKREMEKKKNL